MLRRPRLAVAGVAAPIIQRGNTLGRRASPGISGRPRKAPIVTFEDLFQ
jgi:hypothetical protein